MRHVEPTLTGYYTLEEVAQVIGCNPRSAWRYAHTGILKSVMVQGRYFVPVDALKDFKKPVWGNPNLGKIVKEKFRLARAAARAKENHARAKKHKQRVQKFSSRWS